MVARGIACAPGFSFQGFSVHCPDIAMVMGNGYTKKLCCREDLSWKTCRDTGSHRQFLMISTSIHQEEVARYQSCVAATMMIHWCGGSLLGLIPQALTDSSRLLFWLRH